jgi:hypothetical protein
MNVLDVELLNALQKKIENLQPSAHFEIFKLIKKYGIPFNENSNGIFINMTNISVPCLSELSKHIKWLDEQKSFLQKDEEVKNEYRENFFT